MFIHYNPNPMNKNVEDCVIRALCKVFNDSWENIYTDLSMVGRFLYDMPNSNHVWGEYLKMNGFHYYQIPDECPYCYTIQSFCNDHPIGIFVLATGTHAVAVIDGNYYDSFDSGQEAPLYFFAKEN